MHSKHLSVALAAAAFFSVSAFAQAGAGASSGAAGSTAGTPAPASTSVDVNRNTGSQAPAAAVGGVTSGTGLGVTSGTGVMVAPASGTVAVVPAGSLVAPAPRVYPGGAVVPYNTTTVMGGPAPGISSSTTVTTYSWVNVPMDANQRADFQRWQHLR